MKRKALSILLATALVLSLFSISAFAGQEVSYREINYSTTLEIGTPATGSLTFLSPVAITGSSTGAAAGFTVRLEKDKEYLLSFRATTEYTVLHNINIMVLNNIMQGVFSQDILSTPVVLPERGTIAATAVRFTAPSTGSFRLLITEGSLLVDDYALTSVNYTVAVEELEWEKIKIGTMDELNALRDRINSFSLLTARAAVELTADIDLENANWTGFKVFGGKFDGKGYTIKNFGLGTNNITYSGVLGLVTANAEVKNVKIDNVQSSGGMYVGSLAGKAEYSKIENCSSTGRVDGASTAGGLIGTVVNSEIADCSSSCTVSGALALAGGFIGNASASIIKHCKASGNVSCLVAAGGFAGSTGADVEAYDCSASGTVSGGVNVGGFYGFAGTATNTTKSSATGDVVGKTNVGGFIGEASLNAIGNECFATGKVKGSACVGGFAGCFDGSNNWHNCYCTGNIESANSLFPNTTNYYFGGFVGKYLNINDIFNCYSIGNINVYGDKVGGFAGGCLDSIGALINFKNCYTTAKITITKAAAEKYGSFIGSWSNNGSYIPKAENCFASAQSLTVGGIEITNDSRYIGHSSETFSVKAVDFTDNSAVSELEKSLNEYADTMQFDRWSGRNAANGPMLVFSVDDDSAKGEFNKVIDWVKSQSIILQIPLWIFYVPVMYIVSLFKSIGK